jgi:hypothetical protein
MNRYTSFVKPYLRVDNALFFCLKMRQNQVILEEAHIIRDSLTHFQVFRSKNQGFPDCTKVNFLLYLIYNF